MSMIYDDVGVPRRKQQAMFLLCSRHSEDISYFFIEKKNVSATMNIETQNV